MATELQEYRGTAAQWASENPILADGELGFEQDTQIIKIGDGVTAWNSLGAPPYVPSTALSSKAEILVGSGVAGVTKVSSPGASANKVLKVQSDGSLAWVDDVDLSTLERVGYAAGNYARIDLDNANDAMMESSAHAATTYITNSSAATQHATYDTLDHMAATYVAKAYALSTYETKWVYKIKAANTTRISTTTLTADPDLVFPVLAGGTYLFEMGLFLDDISTTADFQFSMTSGLSTNWHAALHGAPYTATTTDSTMNHRPMGTGTNELPSLIIAGLGAFFYVSIKGIVAVTTPGNFGLTWAQYTSAASPGTILYKGSYLKTVRLS
jgi:Major tropism determinant N-terminal domain